MTRKYKVYLLGEVFAVEIAQYVLSNHGGVGVQQLIMDEVERFEKKSNMEFVCFMGSDFIIFKYTD